MQNHRLLVFFGSLMAVIYGFSGAPALAVTPIAITATDVTMPSHGNGSSQYTITGIPDAGTVTISCLFTGTVTKALIPNCTYGLAFTAIPVTAGQTLTGTVNFYAFGHLPAGLHRAPRSSGHLPAAALALAGGLMLGFGFRRKSRRWLTVAVLALGTLAGVSGINGCGDNGFSMTPGTYQYTIIADYADSVNPTHGAILDAPINVTVP
jgi:hypothetical protein